MTPPSAAAARSPAPPALFSRLIDDAAVFPPGLAPLPRAVEEHRAHRSSGYAALIGPLLVPASDAAGLLALSPGGAEPLQVSLVARPGSPRGAVDDALHLLRPGRQVEVAGVEVVWAPEWRDLELGDVPLVLEVPRGGDDQVRVLDDIAAEAGDGGSVRAKFRTGATPAWDWPDEGELATFVAASVERHLPFKLTGGLHHAVRGTYQGQEQHGLLNVLCAVRRAASGADAVELGEVLAQRDPSRVVPEVARMTDAEVARVRTLFTAYGCCGVTEPVSELSALNLVEVA